MFIGIIANAQTKFISPYSSFGIGDLNHQALIHSSSRGGLELAVFEPNHINLQNPALLANSRLAIFESSVYYKYITQKQNDLKGADSDGNINGAFMAFPLAKFWSTSIGFNNLSKVGFEKKTETILDNTLINRTNDGFGALNQVHLSNGIRIYKGLNVGFTMSYTFGQLSYFDNSVFRPIDNASTRLINVVSYSKATQVSSVLMKTGISYRGKINNNYSYNLGATYLPSRSISSEYFAYTVRQIYSGTNPSNKIDTISITTQKIMLPQQIQFGISIERNKKWMLGVDYSTQEWSKLVIGNTNMGLLNNSKIIVGGEYTPDYLSNNSYFKRCNYKAGVRYEKTPLFINNTQINNFGINFGIELPTDKLRSFINFGIEIGKRGTLNNGLIKENYYGASLGLTLNDRWFLKRRIN